MIRLLLLVATFYYARAANDPAFCENQTTGFFVLDNALLQLQDTIIYKDTSEEECLRTCSHNRDQFGRTILCASFMYDHAQFSCTIYKAKGGPVGEAKMEASVGKRYFEKFCLAERVPLECADSQFIRVDDSVLVGYATNLTVVDSLQECVAQCIKEEKCLSAMYFYDDKECITNSESAMTKPASFNKEEIDRVVYFQNGCHPKNRVQGVPAKVEEHEAAIAERTETLAPDAEHEGAQRTADTNTEEFGEAEASGNLEDLVEKAENVEAPQKSTTANREEPEQEEYDTNQEAEGDEYEEEEEVVEDATEEPTTTTTTTTEAPTTEEPPKKKTKGVNEKKYKKHPRNFASKTLKTKNKKGSIEQFEELEEVSVSPATEEPDADQGEPIEAETQPIKKILKIKKVAEPIQPPPEGYFSEWSDWTPCTKSGERQIRRRRCLDLRRCLGALMQVRNCPAVIQITTAPTIESVRSVVDTNGEEYDDAPGFENISRQSPVSPPVAAPTKPEPKVWGPWQGTCQHFASSQPCNNGNMIGFESRECIAKDASQCEGPFFRYCTITC